MKTARDLPTANVHATAIIHPNARIDESCAVGPYCTIGKDVSLGPNNKLISHVVIENRVTIGSGNIFHPFSVVGGIPQDLKYGGENSEVCIGNNNTIREAVTINTGTTGGGNITRIGDSNLLMAYVHIAHDSSVSNNTIIGNACQIAGHVVIEDWATIGGLSGIGQHIRIGSHCYIGGCSGVDRDVPPFMLARGPTGSCFIVGLNLVGLRRRGFSKKDIATLQKLNKLFFQQTTDSIAEAIEQLELELGSVPVVEQFIAFVKSSQSGLCITHENFRLRGRS